MPPKQSVLKKTSEPVDAEPEAVLAEFAPATAPAVVATTSVPVSTPVSAAARVDKTRAPDAKAYQFSALCQSCEAQIQFDLDCVQFVEPGFLWSLISAEVFEVTCPRCDKPINVSSLIPTWMKSKIKRRGASSS